jgi:hypothetical protein
MSFTDSSSSSVAVRQALYALTALHLYGYDVALGYKNKAVGALAHSHSSQGNATTKDRLQHIAAGLLLGMLRVCVTLLDTSEGQPSDFFHSYQILLKEMITWSGQCMFVTQRRPRTTSTF